MPRPRIPRCIRFKPNVYYFKPRGIPLRLLKEVELTVDELEALRLADYQKLHQIKAAKSMKISQSTFQRILTLARKKVSNALVTGKAIKIHGGKFRLMKRICLILLAIFLFLPSQALAQEEILEGKVVNILEEKQQEGQSYQKIEILVTKGSLKDEKIVVESGYLPTVSQPDYKVNDWVLINYTQDAEGNELFYITDFIRRDSLLLLFFLFVITVTFIGQWRGISSLFGLLISFLVIFKFILPQINAAWDPILTAIIGSLAIIPLTFYLSHGFNQKTTIAIGGTLIALIITGFLAKFFVELARLSGYASEEAAFLQVAKQGNFNIKGLLLAGIIIGALGVLDDITVSQAAIVQQLKETNPKISPQDLFARAMKVGHDHIASMVNTLVLVYTGAALPLLLLFINNPLPFGQVINNEIIAEEIIRTLVASIGLISAVPITSLLASKFLKQK